MADSNLSGRRIVFVAEGFGPEGTALGGAGNLLRSIALETRRHGAEPLVVVDAFARGAPAAREWERDTLPVRMYPLVRSIPSDAAPLGRTHRREIAARLAVPKVARLLRPDLVNLHIHPNGLIRFAWEMKRRAGSKVVISTHGLDAIVHASERWDTAAMKHSWAEAVRGVDVWVPCGPLDHEGLIAWGIPEERIVPIYNGVEVPATLPELPVATRPLVSPAILYLGRVMEKKGIFDLADAVLELARRRPDLRPRLIVAGACPDDLRARLLERFRDAEGLTLELLGEVPSERVPEVIAGADIFCHPTKGPEGLPLSVLEAAAYGAPLIVTRHPAHDAVLESERHALFFEQGDAAGLVDALVRLIADRSLRASLRREAHALVRERHNHPSMLDGYIALYARLLGGGSPGHGTENRRTGGGHG